MFVYIWGKIERNTFYPKKTSKQGDLYSFYFIKKNYTLSPPYKISECKVDYL
jgi:hypothetical protein